MDGVGKDWTAVWRAGVYPWKSMGVKHSSEVLSARKTLPSLSHETAEGAAAPNIAVCVSVSGNSFMEPKQAVWGVGWISQEAHSVSCFSPSHVQAWVQIQILPFADCVVSMSSRII